MAKDKKLGLEVVVSATDKATAKFKEINKRFAQSGLGKLNNSFRLLKGASGLNQFGKAAGNFGRAVGDASSELQGLLFKIGALVGAGGGGLFALANGFARFADNAQDASERLGFTVEAYQKFSIGAQLAGIDQDKFNLMLNKFSRTLGDAKLNGGEAAKAFIKLGIAIRGQKPEEILQQVFEKLNAMPDAFKRNAMTAKMFGKNFGEITPFIKDFARYTQQAGGFIISKEDIQRGDDFNDQIVALKKLFGSLANVAGASMLEGFSEGLKIFSDFLIQNKDEVKEFFKAIGKELPAAFRFLVSSLKTFMGFFSQYDEKTKQATLNVGRVKMALVALGIFLVGPFLASLVTVGTAFIAMFGPLLPILALVSVKAWLIGAAFVAVAALIYKNWEPIKQLFSDIWGFIVKIGDKWSGIFSKDNLRGIAATVMGPAPVAQRNFLQAPQVNTNNATASLNVSFQGMPKGARMSYQNQGYEAINFNNGFMGGSGF